jgi:hypothetical protein
MSRTSVVLWGPALAVALVSWSPALAHSSSARLLADAPLAAATPTAVAGEAALAGPSARVMDSGGPSYPAHLLITVVPAFFASTAGVVLTTLVGSLTNSLAGVGASALLMLLVPPVLTALTALLVGNDSGERYRFWGPLGVAFVLHAAVFIVTSLAFGFAVPWSDPTALLAFAAVDAVLMTLGAVSTMHLFPLKVAPPEIPAFAPGVSPTRIVSLAKVAL